MLIDSTQNAKKFSIHRFPGKINYTWQALAFSSTFSDFCFLDLVLMDEFNEPFFKVSTPLSAAKDRLFENKVDLD